MDYNVNIINEGEYTFENFDKFPEGTKYIKHLHYMNPTINVRNVCFYYKVKSTIKMRQYNYLMFPLYKLNAFIMLNKVDTYYEEGVG